MVELKADEIYRATELAVFLRESKADQYNRGAILVHHAVEREEDFDLCPVRAVRDLFTLFPERMEEERERPLMRWESGNAVTRGELRGLLGDGRVGPGIFGTFTSGSARGRATYPLSFS